MENSIELIGAINVFEVMYEGFCYIRHEEFAEGVSWWDEENQGIWECVIEDDELILSLDREFERIKTNKEKLVIFEGMMNGDLLESKIIHDIMNLGMELRQDQLNGNTSKSGVEALKEYFELEIKKIKL